MNLHCGNNLKLNRKPIVHSFIYSKWILIYFA